MTIFLFSLAGIPPLGGWFAKFEVFRVLATSGETWGYLLAVVAAINSVIALFYYASIARKMWADESAGVDLNQVDITPSLVSALGNLCNSYFAIWNFPPVSSSFHRSEPFGFRCLDNKTSGMLAEDLKSRIRRSGPLSFSDFVEACLYDSENGFYTKTGRAGRRGDFITSPEVGPVFGHLIANWLDHLWTEIEKPKDFQVIEVGAGCGTLARTILDSDPNVLREWKLCDG